MSSTVRTWLIAISYLVSGLVLGAAGAWWWLQNNPQQLGQATTGAALSVDVEKVQFGEYVTLPVPRKVVVKPRVSKVIYLNREGAKLTAGDDLASRNVSSLVRHAKLETLDFPAYSGSARRWRQIVGCIRKAFARYDVKVVDQRPLDGGYIMAMFGGNSKLLGKRSKHSHATGLAPFNGQSIPDAVVFIFTSGLRNSLRGTCETASMEIAHAYGLDHGYNCRDFMTYKRYCGAKRFMDKAIRCGEYKPRDCKGGAKTQNAHAMLLGLLGPTQVKPPAKKKKKR